MGLFGRKRMKTRDAQGRKVVVVTDKRGTVRKTKIKDKKNQITTKERYDRAGNLTKRKAKGKYIKRFKAKTSNPTFDQSVFQGNQQVRNMVSGNPILNAKRNEILNNGTDEQKKVQNNQVVNDSTQNNTNTNTTTTKNEDKEVVNTENIEKKDDKKDTPKSTEKSFGDAYREQRNKNTEAGIDHYGDDSGYFTWKGKKYNTESKEEKAERTKIDAAPTPKVDETPVETNTPDPTLTPDNSDDPAPTDSIPKIDTPDISTPTDSVPNDTIKKMEINRSDTLAKRGGSKGSYRSYRHGGSVGPNGIL